MHNIDQGKSNLLTWRNSKSPRLWYAMILQQPIFWIIVSLCIGAILRTLMYLSDRCLWIDECMLALNIATRSWSGLLEPLEWNQGAPLGYLLLVKGITQWAGISEGSLRSVSFLCSLASLAGFAVLSWRLLPPWAAVGAIALYSISPGLVSYAGECKQYACDTVVTVGLLLLAERLQRHGSWHAMLGMALGGMAALWFSHPAAFVLAGIGVSFLIQTVHQKQVRRFLSLALMGLSWMMSFSVLYFLHLRYLAHNDYLQRYWQEHFLPLTGLGTVNWLWDHGLGWCAVTVGSSGALVGGGLAIWGGIVLGRTRREWTILVVGVVGAALVAAAGHRYPLAGRMVLFLTPLLILLMAAGGWSIWRMCTPQASLIAAFLLVTVLLSAASQSFRECRRPSRSEEIRPLLEVVRQQWRNGDKVLVLRSALPAFLFYTHETPFPPGVVWANSERFIGGQAWEQWQRLRTSARLWVLASHYRSEEEAVIRTLAEGTAHLVGEWHESGAWLRCYVPGCPVQESPALGKDAQ